MKRTNKLTTKQLYWSADNIIFIIMNMFSMQSHTEMRKVYNKNTECFKKRKYIIDNIII